MKTYGLIGEHLSHSFSKEIHESIADYRYDLIPLDKEAFCSFMEDRDFAAVNVTIPYKKAVIPYLDELDEAAQAIGAVNTVVNRDGKLYGYNTDYTGFQYMVRKHGVHRNGKKVLIIGNGGASAAVQAVVRHEGAAQMVIVDIVEGNGAISYEECYRSHLDAQVIINTSPVGMYPHGDAAPVDLERFARCEAVMDVIYNPLMTRLCQQARKRGLVHVNGLEMLVAQAKQAVEHFLDKPVNDEVIDEIYRRLIAERCNIVLIGMPSAGKTSIASLTAARCGKRYIDMDDVIVETAGRSIPEIFAEEGEEGFRQRERDAAAQLGTANGTIISCGGGVIKNEANMDALRQNGVVFFIDRDLSQLISTDSNRPLSSSKEALAEMYAQRIGLYRRYADVIVDNNGDIETAAEAIAAQYAQAIHRALSE